MSANWLDITIGVILATSFFGALRNGVTRELVRLASLAFGIIGAMWTYERAAEEYAAAYISNPQAARFVSFGAIVIGCLIAGTFISWTLTRLWGLTGLRWADRLLGAGFGLIRGMAIATALVLGMVAFAPVAGAEAVVAESQLAPWVLHGAKAVSLVAPAPLRTAYGEGFERVRQAWLAADAVAGKAADSKPSPKIEVEQEAADAQEAEPAESTQ